MWIDKAQNFFFARHRRDSAREDLSVALMDLRSGLKQWSLWTYIGSQDIRQRYRRSKLGPFWLTISMGVTVAALGFLYGGLFKRPLDKYLPYLAAGFVVWGLLSGLVLDGSRCFVGREGLIRQLAAPLSIYVFETLWMNLLIFSHNLVIFGIVSIIFQNEPNLAWLLFLPGILVVLINGVWIALFCGVISARFRDFPQVLASLVQVMFFVTPIIWNPDMLPGRALLLDLNPFYHLLEVVRAPMLGKSPSVDTWIAIALITVAGWTSALTVYSLYRRRLAYWV